MTNAPMHQWASAQGSAPMHLYIPEQCNVPQCIMPCASTVFDEETAAGQLCELAKRGEIEKVTLLLSG